MVIGTPTFGKGLVQTLFPLGDGVALKLTTARWYTPSGRTIQRIAKNEEDQAEQAAQEAGDTIPGATEVVEIDGGRLFFPDERAGELTAALRRHWEANP